MRIGYLTDKGRNREKNEDAIRVLADKNFFMLADGVGGNKAGEVASAAALGFLQEYIENNPITLVDGKENIFKYFENAANYVNESIFMMAKSQREYKGMATTLVFAYISDQILYIANIGDSRVYFLHDKEIHQITEDHTYVNDLVRMGAITKEEAANHSKKNIITRAIGVNAYNNPDCYNIYIEDEDKILICSDGLYDEVKDKDILNLMQHETNMDNCARVLIDTANGNGGSDNISVICIDMVEE